jgi:glycosyltransferase involved in cell wall biosynthesis
LKFVDRINPSDLSKTTERVTLPIATALFSIIIAVYDDWGPLDRCLESLAQQIGAPDFEVIVLDDCSQEGAPQSIRRWAGGYPLTIVRQPHAGIAAARNHGIRVSKGSVLVFVDADCKLHERCLARLHLATVASPQHHYFQLRLTGDCSRLVGKSEQLRLQSIQDHKLRPDSRIPYLNTSGFAVRRARAEVEGSLFDPTVVRAEDTLLLVNLMKSGSIPLFVDQAVVQHAIPLSLTECLRKDIRSAYLEGQTYALIGTMGVTVRVSWRERLQILRSTWKIASQHPAGRSGWMLFVVRTIVQRLTSLAYPYLRVLLKLPRSRGPVLKSATPIRL